MIQGPSISPFATASWCCVSEFSLLIWGAISFKQLPVEAYPDVANNYVQVITQWPGRAAEEVEQQVTIPIEVADERLAAPAASALRVAVRPLERRC